VAPFVYVDVNDCRAKPTGLNASVDFVVVVMDWVEVCKVSSGTGVEILAPSVILDEAIDLSEYRLDAAFEIRDGNTHCKLLVDYNDSADFFYGLL
jgi:hypothetical protein